METEKKNYSIIQWLLFVFIIPVIFLAGVSFFLLHAAGVDTTKLINNVKDMFPQNEHEEVQPNETQSKKLEKLEVELASNVKVVEDLEKQVKAKQGEVDTLTEEIVALTTELNRINHVNKQQSETLSRENLAKLYELISAKNVALIIPNLSEPDAVNILSSLKPEKLAEVFEKMTPEEAAKYTNLLSK